MLPRNVLAQESNIIKFISTMPANTHQPIQDAATYVDLVRDHIESHGHTWRAGLATSVTADQLENDQEIATEVRCPGGGAMD